MPEVYAQQLDLTPLPGVDPQAAIVTSLREWVGPRWDGDREWFTPAEPDGVRAQDGSVFRWEPYVDGSATLLEFTWRHPQTSEEGTSVTWSTQVAFYDSDGGYRLTLRVSNTGPEIGVKGALLTTRPRLISHLGKFFTARCDGYAIKDHPTVLASDAISSFVRYCVFDPSRRHPLLLLSPQPDGRYAVSPDVVASDFATLAEPFILDSTATTYALTDELGVRSLSCFNGALRVYQPGITKQSNPLEHPLIFGNRVRPSSGRLALAKMLSAKTALRFTPEPRFHALRDERALAAEGQRRSLLESLESYKNVGADAVTWQTLAEDYSKENNALRAQRAALEEDLRETEGKLAAARFALAQRAGNEVGPDEVFDPADAHEAVEMAKVMFEDTVLVLDSALSTAEDSPFARPHEVWEALRHIHEISERRLEGPLGMSFKEAFRELGEDYRGGISATSSKELRQQYKFRQDGVEYTCEEHLCFGGSSYDPATCLRIYLSTKQESDPRIVIGHVGRHLDTVSTT